MYDIFFTSDTHFGHANIIKFCRPEFEEVMEMTEKLIENWNSFVKPNDVVYHCGDFLWKHPPAPYKEDEWARMICSRLNGRIRLILGNHDNPELLIKAGHVETIQCWGVFKKEKFCMTHFPIALNQCPPGFANVHGHIHANDSHEAHQINICVEKTGYHPVPYENMCKAVTMIRGMMYKEGLIDV